MRTGIYPDVDPIQWEIEEPGESREEELRKRAGSRGREGRREEKGGEEESRIGEEESILSIHVLHPNSLAICIPSHRRAKLQLQ